MTAVEVKLDYAYDAEAWHDLYLFLGAAAAALMGLVFIAMSLHLTTIIGNVLARAQSRGALGMLFCIVVVSIFVLIPHQPTWLLGGELMLYGGGYLVYIGRNILRTRRGTPPPPVLVLATLGSYLLLFVAGLSIAIHQAGGFYWLAAASLALVTLAVFISWHLMVALAERELENVSPVRA